MIQIIWLNAFFFINLGLNAYFCQIKLKRNLTLKLIFITLKKIF